MGDICKFDTKEVGDFGFEGDFKGLAKFFFKFLFDIFAGAEIDEIIYV